MRKELITLTRQEHERYTIIKRVLKREMRQAEAADLLNLTERQVRNLRDKVREKGIRGMAHGNRGRPSLRKMSMELEERIAKIVRERYEDFKPKLASEKLWANERIRISDEKLRQVMIAQGLWRARRRRGPVHVWRERKARYGEMVQMDGSHHAWMEGRGPKLVLMAFIDDATNRAWGRFYAYEGVWPAMDALEGYVRRWGLPQSLYLDRHSTYKTTRQASTEELLRGQEAQTQFERAAGELGIRLIHAYSPQAKGRIERLFGTLQDRLVKEMRLAGLAEASEANLFLEGFWPRFNEQFAKEARESGNLHRPLLKTVNLREVLCLKDTRTINNGYLVRWHGRMLAIQNPTLGMRRRPAQVLEHPDGRIVIRFNGRDLLIREVLQETARPALPRQPKAEKPKTGKYIPPADHPWRRSNKIIHREWAQGIF
ncbi:MAG TPA: ISNCY family transposase [Thermodesulfobacteriota bacterium]